MTDFNNLDTQLDINTEGEESKFSSPESVSDENANIVAVTETIDSEEIIKSQATDPKFNKSLDPELFEEKTKIKRDARTIGAAFLAMYGVILVLNVMVIIINLILTLSNAKNAVEILNSPAVLQVMQIIFASTAFTLPFVLIYKFSSVRISDIISFSLPKKRLIVPFFLFGISFCSFANIVSSIAAAIFEKSNINYDVAMPENPKGIFGFMLSLISTVMVPALVEEFACRGLILGLLRKHGDAFAIIVSSVLFGVMHGNFEQMPFAFLVGLVLGFITVKSGSVLIAIAVHAFNNFVSVAFDYLFVGVPQAYQNVGYMIFLTVCLLLGIFATFLIKEDQEVYTLTPSNMKAGEGKKAVWFFTSVPIIFYMAICLVESLQFFVI